MPRDLKGAKDALVSSLFSLQKAAQDASYAVLEFVNSIENTKTDTAAVIESLNAPIAAAAAAASGASAVLSIDDPKAIKSDAAVDAPVDEPKKRKRVAKVRDPNAPKRPLPAYLVFGNEIKRDVRREREAKGEDPLSMSQLNEIVQAKWSELDEKSKKALEEDQAKALVKYNKLREAYESKQNDGTAVGAADATPTGAAEVAEEAEPAAAAAEEESQPKKPKTEKRKPDGEKKRKKRKDKTDPASSP